MKHGKLLTPLEIYKVLEQSNCKRCMLPSCLAFSAAVIGGQKKLDDCPLLSDELKKSLSRKLENRSAAAPTQAVFIDTLLHKVRGLDLSVVAPDIGASYANGLLSVRSLGKEFHVDRKGKIRSECHLIPWVQAPLLAYICHSGHQQISGRWISFREIQGGIEWRGLFRSRCETPLRKLADTYPELFVDIIHLFMGREVEGFDADIALVLHPFPHIPILFCYQAADRDLESELNIFFDECCGTNLHIKSLYTLCAGLVKMFEQIALHHY